jgi:hypothetical protein
VENVVNEDQLARLQQAGVVKMPPEKYKAYEYNKAIMFRLLNGVWNRKDYSLIDKYVAVDMVQHLQGEGTGRKGFREAVKKYHTAFSDVNLVIEDEMADANRQACVIHRYGYSVCKKWANAGALV